MLTSSVVAAVRNVLPAHVPIKVAQRQGRDIHITVAGSRLSIRRLDRGWPRQVTEALAELPRPDVLIAPSMSPGARAAAAAAGVGWLDESGAAQIAVGPIVVSRSGVPVAVRPPVARWTPSVFAVSEALLTGTTATVAAVTGRTRLSEGAATKALGFLTQQGLLVSDVSRGRNSSRRVTDRDQFLDTYAEHVALSRSLAEVQVGVVWRDPLTEAAQLGESWNAKGRTWAATSALAAAVLAPQQTQISPLEIYIACAGHAELISAAGEVGLTPLVGGRLRLRQFPSSGTAALVELIDSMLICVPWPRVYADLRNTGVRGEYAAEHLRQEIGHG